MKRALFLAAALSMFSISLSAQQLIDMRSGVYCSYIPQPATNSVYGFAPDAEVTTIVDSIMKYAGLPQNFIVVASDVQNAAALFQNGRRLILYNQSFVHDMVAKTHTTWAPTSVLAHEIGHHLSNHTLLSSGGTGRPDQELQADQFSGHTLFKMGASLEQAKIAMESLDSYQSNQDYPPKSARLAAIANGWMLAKDQEAKLRPQPQTVDDEQQPAPKPKTVTKSRHSPSSDESSDDDDDLPPTPKAKRSSSGAYCCDVFGNRRCILNTGPMPLGQSCFCFGQGYGFICQ